MSRLKALQRVPSTRTLLPKLELLKSFFELTGRPSKDLDKYFATRTLEGLFQGRPSRPFNLDRYIASGIRTLEGFFELTGLPSRAFSLNTYVAFGQNLLQCLQSTETVNSVLKLAAPHCSVTAQSIWLALPCFTGQSQQGKEASSKFVRLCCCGAGCLVNYSCLC